MTLTAKDESDTMSAVMRAWCAVLMLFFVYGCVSDAYAAPEITRILRKNNKMAGHRDGFSRSTEPTYRTPKYYPESYPEYGRQRSSPDAGWQQVPDYRPSYNSTPSYGTGGPRAARRRWR